MQRVKRNGQVTIPKNMRDRFGIHDGDWVEVTAEEDAIVVRALEVVKTYRRCSITA